jgi:hypothetical protein
MISPFFRTDTVEIVVPNGKYRQCVAVEKSKIYPNVAKGSHVDGSERRDRSSGLKGDGALGLRGEWVQRQKEDGPLMAVRRSRHKGEGRLLPWRCRIFATVLKQNGVLFSTTHEPCKYQASAYLPRWSLAWRFQDALPDRPPLHPAKHHRLPATLVLANAISPRKRRR